MNIIERIASGLFGFFILSFAYYSLWDFAVPLFWDDAINYDPYWAIGPEHLCWMMAIFVTIGSVVVTLLGLGLIIIGLFPAETVTEENEEQQGDENNGTESNNV